VLTHARSQTDPAAALPARSTADRGPRPTGRRPRVDPVSLVLLVVLAAAVGVICGRVVLAPLFLGVGGPPAEARAVAVLAAAVLTLVWTARRAGGGDAPARRDHPDGLAGDPPAAPHAAWGRDVPLASVLASLADAVDGRTVNPTPLTVHLGARLVEVFWDGPPPPPHPPWAATASGWVWEADPGCLDPLRRPVRPGWPALVALGTTPTGSLWLNLGAFRVVALAGDAAAVGAGGRALRAQLQRADTAGGLDLVVLAGAAPSTGTLSDVDAVTPERAVSLLWQRRGTRRARQRGATRPLVVAIGAETTGQEARPVLDAARADRGVTCLVQGPAPGADLCLTLGANQVHVPFLGDVPVRAAWDHVPTPPPAPEADRATAAPRAEPPAAPPADPSPARVRVLGPVTVEGTSGALSAKGVELVAYLACHRAGARDDQIQAAVWPERLLTSQSWATRVSVTRRALGRDPEGQPRLLRFRAHVGRLAPSLGCDLDELDDALRSATAAQPPEVMRRLRAALALVRGQPFAAPRGYEWAVTEGHIARAERLVVDAAHRLGEVMLGAADPAGARWAAEQGLRASPASELLREDLRRAGGRPGSDPGRRDPVRAGTVDPAPAGASDVAAVFERVRVAVAGPAPARPDPSRPGPPGVDD